MRCSTVLRDSGRKFSFLLGLGSVLCCVMHAQTVRTSFQPGLDFSKFHTYRWVQIKGVHPDPNVDAQIKESVDSRLAKKGLTKTNGAADLYVDYQVAISKAERWQTYEDWSSVGALDGRIPMRKQVTIEVGTLIIDIYASAAKQLVWSGRANKVLDPNSSPEQRKKNIDNAAQNLLKNYPPK
jgi:Domain of unknown function (DUF4136)